MSAPENTRKVIGSVARNGRGDTVAVSLSEYQGHHLVDIRQCFLAKDGKEQPTQKGVSIRVDLLDSIIALLSRARTEAFARGWLVDESSEERAA